MATGSALIASVSIASNSHVLSWAYRGVVKVGWKAVLSHIEFQSFLFILAADLLLLLSSWLWLKGRIRPALLALIAFIALVMFGRWIAYSWQINPANAGR